MIFTGNFRIGGAFLESARGGGGLGAKGGRRSKA